MANFKKYIPYLLVLISFLAGIFLIAVLMDMVIFPWMIHNKETAEIPDVTGKTIGEAKKILDTKGFKIDKITEQNSDSVAAGIVINQVPKAGQIVKTERNIYLVISKGAELGTAPYIIGLPERAARVLISNKGMTVGNVDYINSDQYGQDTVVAQSIPSGKEIPIGSSINYSISKGPEEQVLVPNLKNKTLEEVNKILLENGLTLGNVTVNTKKNETFQPNTVFEQSPEEGTLVKKGSAINITISK